MRPSRRMAPVIAAITLLMALPYDAASQTLAEDRPEPFGSTCRTRITGSEAVAYCHNPYVPVDRVRLHIECDRWWDIDSDSPPQEAFPAMTVRLTGRCWKEIRSVWVSHER
ncbi:hypothetical protein [Streptomyces cavernae]|uniref:hypothetical protein n=1 Tax=Streptomyces cavernae TaxID=2259034 RepID=UPI000FEBCECA|nr:hypothetical protein [Streptomyces cavernae]